MSTENQHCHETGRRIELLNEYSQTLYIEYRLAQDGEGEDRYPVVDLAVQDLDSTRHRFQLCSRDDCNKVIEILWSVRNAAFPQ